MFGVPRHAFWKGSGAGSTGKTLRAYRTLRYTNFCAYWKQF